MEGMGQPLPARNQQPQYDNVGSQAPRPANDRNQTTETKTSHWYQPTFASKLLMILVIIAAVLVLAALVTGIFSRPANVSGLVKNDQYQAVFLTNGQVYFGKISALNSEAMVLEDIYYLQVEQQIQPEQESANQEPQISLAKLGNELHGPEDMMIINMSAVVFWENLRDDGRVVEAILAFRNGDGENLEAPAGDNAVVPEDGTEPATEPEDQDDVEDDTDEE